MNSTLTIKARGLKKARIEINSHAFERLAANLGFFNPDFIKSIKSAERDYRKGKTKHNASLKELRSRT